MVSSAVSISDLIVVSSLWVPVSVLASEFLFIEVSLVGVRFRLSNCVFSHGFGLSFKRGLNGGFSSCFGLFLGFSLVFV